MLDTGTLYWVSLRLTVSPWYWRRCGCCCRICRCQNNILNGERRHRTSTANIAWWPSVEERLHYVLSRLALFGSNHLLLPMLVRTPKNIGPIRFRAGWRKGRINRALSVLGFLCVLCFFARVTLTAFHYFDFFLRVLSLEVVQLGCQYQCKWLKRLVSARNDLYCVDGDVKPYSLTHSSVAHQPITTHHRLRLNPMLTLRMRTHRNILPP